MAGQQIAQFFAKVGLLIENKEFAKVDQALKNVEKQLGKVVGGSAKETKAKKDATAATEKKVKAVEKETKATKDLNREQEKQNKDIARRLKQQQAILKKADAEALKQANAFLTLQKKLANANPGLKTLSQRQIAANRAAFFGSARASDLRTGQGLQYRLGAQADAKIKQMLAGQKVLLASRTVTTPVANNKVFEELQLRLASKLKTPRYLSESQINKNRAAFFSSARILETKTGQGLQYRLGDQVAKIQQATQREQEQAAVKNQRQAQKVGDAVEKGLRDLEREIQKAFSPVQNSRARLNAVRGGGGRGGGGTGGGRSAASYSRANFLHAGGAGGALARYGVESLPFIGGAYGMVQLNQANQNMMSANIAAESVLGPEAKARMDWLSQRVNYLGVNYAETLPQFTKFMASASPLLGGDAAQETFSSFMQFGRTRGATSVSMNRALNAVAQMGAKGQIMQEELEYYRLAA